MKMNLFRIPLSYKNLSTVLLFLLGPTLFAANQYFEEYGRLPIKVTQGSGANIQKYILKNFDGKNFILAQEGMQEMEISLPVATTDPLEFVPGDDYKKAINLLSERKFVEGIEAYRPVAYSLIKFASAPTNKLNIHQPIRILIDALLEIQAVDEIYEIYQKLDISSVDDLFIEKIFDVVQGLIKAKDYNKAMELVKDIPLSLSRTEYLEDVIHAAGLFVLAEQYELALDLYERTQRYRNSDLHQQVLLWIAYCRDKTGETKSARYYMDEKVGEIETSSPNYSLFRLIKGILLMRGNDYRNAMDEIAQGVVNADRSMIWMPELLFQSAQCYYFLEKKDVAKSILNEIKLFYPESVWASKSL